MKLLDRIAPGPELVGRRMVAWPSDPVTTVRPTFSGHWILVEAPRYDGDPAPHVLWEAWVPFGETVRAVA